MFTGLEDKTVSRVIYGTLFLNQVEDANALLDQVWMQGCNAFDCAASYGGGACDTALGEWMISRGIKPTEVVIFGKGGASGADQKWKPFLNDMARLRDEMKTSLDRLRIKQFDCYMLHRDDESMGVDTIVDMMEGLHREGFFTCWGVSNWTVERVRAAVDYANTKSKPRPVCNSVQSSLAVPKHNVWPGTVYLRPSEHGAYEELGVHTLAWECLAKGFMAGKWNRAEYPKPSQSEPEAAVANQDPFSTEWREHRITSAYCIATNFDRRDRADELALALSDSFGDRLGEQEGDQSVVTKVTSAMVALAYSMSTPKNGYVLVGTTKAGNFRDNMFASCLNLGEAEIRWLERGPTGDVPTAAAAVAAVVKERAAKRGLGGENAAENGGAGGSSAGEARGNKNARVNDNP